jgi:deoxyribonuclease (pyrimidine dimer)
MRSLFAIAVAMKKSSDGFAAPRLSFLNAVSQCIMTRINCGIPPAELSDRHLIAEHREIKRVPNLVRKGRYSMKGQPVEFTLGTGHIKFFYDKLGYLLERYQQLYDECINRGFNVTNYASAWDDVPQEMMGSYMPKESDIDAIRKRIRERGG